VVPQAQRPPWQSFLDAIGPAPPANLSLAQRPETIVYVIEPFPASQRLTFQILGRSHKKNGEWGKWKQLSIRLDDLHLLDPFDRESLALLNQHTWAHTVERMVNIPRRRPRGGSSGSRGRENSASRQGTGDPRMIAWDGTGRHGR